VVRAEVVAHAGFPDGFRAWPVTDSYADIVLDGNQPDEQIALLVANIAWLAGSPKLPVAQRLLRRHPPTVAQLAEPSAVLDRILDARRLSSQGGVRLTDDTTGTVIAPGCCTHVRGWTDWTDLLLYGRPVVMGHDPEVVVALRDDICLAWATEDMNTDDRGPLPDDPHIEFPKSTVPELVSEMQRGLVATTDRIGQWVSTIVPGRVDELVIRIREQWDVADNDRPHSFTWAV
jgi:hypothetical protein